VLGITLVGILPMSAVRFKGGPPSMMTALSGSSQVTQAAIASLFSPVAPVSQAASPVSDRTTSTDTVTISAAGQQASQAAQDVDRDGDSQ
jgi:hypothetical protein